MSDELDWRSLVAAAGRDPAQFTVAQQWRRNDEGKAHLVLRLDGPETLVFKQVLSPLPLTRFTEITQAQRRAAAAMTDPHRVPAILASDEGARAWLMEYAPGETVFCRCESAPEDTEPLRRAGAWLAAFHRSAGTESRRYQPRFMTDHLSSLLGEIANGSPVAFAPSFRNLAGAVLREADPARDAATVSAVRHGDPITRNIILDAGRSWGIDLGPATNGPVGFDIARLLVNWAENFADPDDLTPGKPLPAAALGAFFQGYDLVRPDDASVRFLILMRMVTNWRALPADPDRMAIPDLIRVERLRLLLRNALGKS